MVKKNNLIGDMPHSLEAEQALLGCLLLDTKVQVEIGAYLKVEDFYAESHRIIFSAMLDIIKLNQPVDLVTLTDFLEKNGSLDSVGGISYITELTNVMPSSANYQRYLEIVIRDSTLRKLIKGSAEVIEACKTSTDAKTTISFAEKTIYDISAETDTSEMATIDAIIPQVYKKFDDLANDNSNMKGIKTGFKGLDYMTNGLHKSDLVIIAARPAVGKTSFAMNIVENVALQGKTCAVFSLEMSKEQITERMLCSVAEVPMEHTKKGILTKPEWMKIHKARELLSNSKIHIDDSAIIRPREIMSKCRRIKARCGSLDLVMVDYIGLMTPDKVRNSDNRQNEITEISRNLKILAKELNVTVLALSQLNRAVETRKGKPQLSDLRESGAIEQDADIVMFIHRPDKNPSDKELKEGTVVANVADIIISKHRSGPTGEFKLYFKGECTKFVNLTDENGNPEGETDGGEKIVMPKEDESQLPPIDRNLDQESTVEQDDAEEVTQTDVDESIF